jgi:hypothetical protein
MQLHIQHASELARQIQSGANSVFEGVVPLASSVSVCSALTTLIDSEQQVDKFWAQLKIAYPTELVAIKVFAEYFRKRHEVGTAHVNSVSTARDGARHRDSRCCTSPTSSPKALLIPSEAESPRWKQRGLFCALIFAISAGENQ